MLHAGGADRLQVARLYFVSNRILMTLTIALSVVGVVLAERFLLLWLGANVTPGLVLAFRLLIVAYLMASASVVASNILSGRGNAHRGAWFAALGGVMTVTAGVLLIPRLGVEGAGWAGVIGMSQAVVFDLWMEHDLRAEHPEYAAGQRRPWVGWGVAGVAAGVTAWLVQHALAGWFGLLAAGALGIAAFAAAWFGARFASAEERQIAARVLALLKDRINDRKTA
jgi:O-antigen/teichoic acid export membrane protein